MFGEVKVHAAIRASDLHISAEDLAAISVHGARMVESAPVPSPPRPSDAFDPMQSFSLAAHDSSVPPPSSDAARRASGTRLLSAPAVKPHEAIGRLVAGRYAVLRVVGAGGMASVLEATDQTNGDNVAVKVMHGDYARDPEIVARFQREARAAAAVASDHIVRVIDVGRDDTVGLFLVMELLEGEDLGALLHRETRLPALVACALVWQAADGLARAQEVGVLHRDIKPANLFIARDGDAVRVKVLDFGIAKLDDGGPGGLTRVGTVLGTPQYMSPEQAQARPLGPRSDVYSLGAVLFEAVAGRPLVAERETLQETLFAAATEAPISLSAVLPDVDPRVAKLVEDMLFRDPSLRPDMSTVCERLAALDPSVKSPVLRDSLAVGVRRATTERRIRASSAATAVLAPKAKAIEAKAAPVPAAPAPGARQGKPAAKPLPLVPMVIGFLVLVLAVVIAFSR